MILVVFTSGLWAQADIYQKKVTCDYENRPVAEVIADLAKQTQLTITVAPDVQGIINIHLGETTLDRALSTICATTNSYFGLVDEKTLVVSSQLDPKGPYYQYIATTRMIKVKYYTADEMKKLLATYPFVNLLTPDERSNSLMIWAPPIIIDRIQKIIEAIDQPRGQIMIEFTALNTTGTKLAVFGSDWEVNHGLKPDANGIYTFQMHNMTFGYQLGSDAARQILLSLFWTKSAEQIKSMAQPKVIIPDNGTAEIYIGNEVWVPSITVIGATSAQIGQLQKVPAGITLNVSARIIAPNQIIVTINNAEVSELLSTGSWGQLTVSARRIKSLDGIRVFDKQSIVIGGLLGRIVQQYLQKVPVLSEIPLIGPWLFQQKRHESRDQEVTMLITATILTEGVPLPPEIAREIQRAEEVTEERKPEPVTPTSAVEPETKPAPTPEPTPNPAPK
jgi:type II secretory pathway component GspD/PulD (secretin)